MINTILNEEIISNVSRFNNNLNQVYLCENIDLLKRLSTGVIDLIYIDPPYCTEEDYIEFSDKWESVSGYIGYMRERILEIHRILKNTGSFYLQCDKHAKFELKLLLDNIFGKKNFRREIIWNTGSVSGFKSKVNGWIRQHDTILYYTKSNNFTFNKLFLPYSVNYIEKMFRYKDEDGRIYRKRRNGRQYLDESKGKPIGSVWNDVLSFQTRTNAKEYFKYPTQKPLSLIQRIILASSNEDDIVADFFCGSGTTIIAAKKAKRNFIACDKNPNAIELCKKRIRGLK
ncbi:MAG: site-specific DNA-methyltransferase [Patescibacteria group bacterium]|nr:site-specific DNA-methyltransferase [Patescibacteria group bacterium]